MIALGLPSTSLIACHRPAGEGWATATLGKQRKSAAAYVAQRARANEVIRV
jgi:hypothetical protein